MKLVHAATACLRLRVKDIDFAANQIIVREGKGDKDRITILPTSIKPALQEHLQRVRLLHEKGHGQVYLTEALARKYPAGPREWPRQYVFPG